MEREYSLFERSSCINFNEGLPIGTTDITITVSFQYRSPFCEELGLDRHYTFIPVSPLSPQHALGKRGPP